MAQAKQPKLTINNEEYVIADLSDKARAQLDSLQYAEGEMRRLNRELAMATTARNAYSQGLQAELSSKSAATPAATKKAPANKKAAAKK
jgi:seryl-tRNA synthetase